MARGSSGRGSGVAIPGGTKAGRAVSSSTTRLGREGNIRGISHVTLGFNNPVGFRGGTSRSGDAARVSITRRKR